MIPAPSVSAVPPASSSLVAQLAAVAATHRPTLWSLGGPRGGLLRGLAAWLRFVWAFVRHRRRRAQLTPTFAAGTAPDCAACLDHCCKGPAVVSLRLADIARLHEAGLGHGIVALDPEKRRRLYQQHPELAGFEAQASVQRFPVLAQTAAGECVFLDEARRCSIYDLRPASCRRYPALLGEDLATLRWARFCKSVRQDAEAHNALIGAAALHHNQKLEDLWLLEVAWADLERLGLTRYLPEAAQRRRGERFEAVLARGRAAEPSAAATVEASAVDEGPTEF